MAITSLKQTKWLFNETFTSCTVEPDATINFKSNNVDYTRFDLMINPTNQSVFVIQYVNDDGSVTAYSTSGWSNQEYRTITIVDGNDVENPTLIAFLEANAVQLEYDLVEPEAPVEPETPVEPEVPEDKPLRFQETNTNLAIYENLTAKDYEALEKKEHALYIVKDVGIYKGTKLIARNEDVTKMGLEKTLNLYGRHEPVTEVTNLTDTMIQFNDTIDMPLGSWEINFNTSNNYNDNGYWGRIEIRTDYMNADQIIIQYLYITSQTEDSTSWSGETVYQNGQWIDRADQTIFVTGGDSVHSSRLIEALLSNSSISMPQNNKYQFNVYEISSLDEFHLIRKDPNAFYLVANNGVYKGSVLIASSISEDRLDDVMSVYHLQEDDSFESVETFHRLKNGHYSCIAAEDGTIVYQNLFSESENTIICNRFLGFANGNNANEDENGFDGCGQIYYRLRYDPNTDTVSYTSYIVQNNSVFPNPNLNNTNGIKEISEPLETLLINNTLYSVSPIAGEHIYIDSDNAINLNLPSVTKSFTYGNISSMANASFTKDDFDKLRYHASVLGFTSYQGTTKAAAYMFKPVYTGLDTIDGATVETMELVCDSTPKMRLILTLNGSTNTVTSSWSQDTSVDETTIQNMIDSAIANTLQGGY